MRRRVVASLMTCALAAALVVVVTQLAADPPDGKAPAKGAPPPAAKADRETPPPVAPADVKVAASRVAAVTVYPNSALVTREVDVPATAGTVELTVTPLP